MADKDDMRITEIFAAIRQYDEERVRALIADGLSTEVRNRSGSTPLMLAGRIGSFNTFFALLELGADVNARDSRGMSVMHHTCNDIADPTIAALIDAGADDESIVQGLERAAYQGKDSNLVTLMQKRPDIMLQPGMADEIIQIARSKKRPMAMKAVAAFMTLYPLEKWTSVQSFNDALETIIPGTRKLFRHDAMVSKVHRNVTMRHRMIRRQPQI